MDNDFWVNQVLLMKEKEFLGDTKKVEYCNGTASGSFTYTYPHKDKKSFYFSHIQSKIYSYFFMNSIFENLFLIFNRGSVPDCIISLRALSSTYIDGFTSFKCLNIFDLDIAIGLSTESA